MIAKELGCEYFEISYPFNLSEKSHCIVSNIENDENKLSEENPEKKNINIYDNFNYELKQIDLSSKLYELDNSLINLISCCVMMFIICYYM